jgi:hypothetical protein
VVDQFLGPTSCVKCGGAMEQGFTVDNDKVLDVPHPAYGERMKLGGSESWYRLSKPSSDKEGKVSLFGHGFMADLVIADSKGIQVFTYRCVDCGFLEAYAPKLK